MVHILDRENTILNRFIAEIRDSRIQKDRMRFRRNLERFGEVMAYEISKSFHYSPRTVETPLGEAEVMLPDEEIVLATILRAGIPFHQGFLNYFDDASCAFVSAYRRYSKDGTFNIRVEYVSAGDLTDKTLLLVDPMLATGVFARARLRGARGAQGKAGETARRRRDSERGGRRVRSQTLACRRYHHLVRVGRPGTHGTLLHRTGIGRCGRPRIWS